MNQYGAIWSIWRFKKALVPASLCLLAFAVLLPVAPHLQPFPSTDSSVFLYIGERVLDGKLPYRDVWDHKGPLIYYINALGLMLSPDSRWGVWFLELVAILGAALLGYKPMQVAFGKEIAGLASLLWILALPAVLDGGNLTEEYALFFQFALIWVFWRTQQDRKGAYFVLVGMISAFLFLLRPNLVGLSIAIGFFFLWRFANERQRSTLNEMLLTASGLAAVGVLVFLYFLLNRGLKPFWDEVIRFNLVYSDVPNNERIAAFLRGLEQFQVLSLLAISGWLMLILRRKRDQDYTHLAGPLAIIGMLAFPIEVVLVSLPGRQYPHYYMTWLPVFVLLSAIFLHTVFEGFSAPGQADSSVLPMKTAVTASLVVALSIAPVYRLWPSVKTTFESAISEGGLPSPDLDTPSSRKYVDVVDYISTSLSPDKKILFWGNMLTVSWMTDRESPTRFIYQAPLFVGDYLRKEFVDEIIWDLENSQAVIIDTTPPIVTFPSLGVRYDRLPKMLRPLYRYIDQHYVATEVLELSGWVVYKHIETLNTGGE